MKICEREEPAPVSQYNPDYPGVWQATYRAREDGTYAGMVTQLLSPRSDRSRSCKHPHKQAGRATVCAYLQAVELNNKGATT